jgi:hypothetical protein
MGLKEFFENTTKYIPLFAAIIGSYGAYIVSQRKDVLAIAEKRYYELIFPVFDLLEPQLFSKNFDFNIMVKILEILNKDGNRAIAGRNIIYAIELCQATKSIKDFNGLCKIISNEHDTLCSQLKIPGRGGRYKLKRKQYPDKLAYIKGFLYYNIFLQIYIIILSLAFTILFITSFYVLFGYFDLH